MSNKSFKIKPRVSAAIMKPVGDSEEKTGGKIGGKLG